jgi:hypothetical protein
MAMSTSGPTSTSSSGNVPSSSSGIGMGGGPPMSTVFPLFLGNSNGDNVFNSITIILSFYAPIIIIFGVFILSVFSASLSKAFVFIFWFFVITGIRQMISKITGSTSPRIPGDNICNTSVFGSLIPNTNLTYSTYILAFTMFYFVFPMVLINNDNNSDIFNYRIILFFVAYLIFDLLIKKSKGCLGIITGVTVLSDLVGGITAGIITSSIMYYIGRSYLFINETASNAQVCSMPSKQQFKCSVYKNGELVSSSVN